MALQLAKRMEGLDSSPIREILSLSQTDDVISFAGGLPAPNMLPQLSGGELCKTLGQYGPTEGEPVLREQIALQLRERGLRVSAEQVIVINGSQQGIDLVSKLLLDPGDRVALESPSYLAAMQVFSLFEAKFASLGCSAHGIDFSKIQQILDAKVKLCYLVPTFQNPTGYAYRSDERRQMARLLDNSAVPLLEDEPYRELNYESESDYTPICASLQRAPWIYQGTFSKVFAPGLRVGYLAVCPELVEPIVKLKQAADLHTQRPGQHWISQWIASGEHREHVNKLRVEYKIRRDQMQKQLELQFSELADWQQPSGGLFFWLRLRNRCDTRKYLSRALAAGVAFMPGESFFCKDNCEYGYLRLNFSGAKLEEFEQGLVRLRRVFEEV